MSSWQPLRPADTSSAPSTLTSLEATPEPEHRAKRKANAGVKVEEVALKLNKFGTVDKTCATPGCDWTLDPTRSIDICVVCEQKRHAEKEKEKLRMILSMRAQGEAVSASVLRFRSSRAVLRRLSLRFLRSFQRFAYR